MTHQPRDNVADRAGVVAAVTVAPDGTRVWRHHPFDFSRHRKVAQVDADRLSDLRNSVHGACNAAK